MCFKRVYALINQLICITKNEKLFARILIRAVLKLAYPALRKF